MKGSVLTQYPIQVLEPEKCVCWEWKSWGDVRAAIAGEDGENKVFLPIENLLRDHPNIETLTTAAGAGA